MSIKIHHGAPGSYKTSGAIADDFVRAAVEGRHVITNVRGLDDENRVREVLEGQGKTIPESFQLTHLDSTDSETMESLRCFWHWSPDGVFFIIDEVQEVWPKSYKDTHLKKLEYPGGIEKANADGKFLTIELAFEKHRHRNWDFIVTTPHISKVHSVVRGSAEAAYKHKNLAMLGKLFKGRYVEGFHSSDSNGRGSDFYSVIRKKVPSYVFDLYKSTATGVVTDTTAGQSIFANPKVLFLLGILALVLLLVFNAGLPAIFGGKSKPVDTETVVPPSPVPAGSTGASPPPASAPRVGAVGAVAPPALPPFVNYMNTATIYYSGGFAIDPESIRLLLVFPDGTETRVAKRQLLRSGLQLVDRGDCTAELFLHGKPYKFINCPPPIIDAPLDQSPPGRIDPGANEITLTGVNPFDKN